MLRVLHLTDPHLFADASAALRGAVTYASLEAVLDHYRDGAWRADVALVTGDLIQDDSAQAYAHCRDLLGGLGLPVYCLPGNHDVRPLMRAALADEPFRYCASLQQDDWLLVCLDSCVDGSAGGRLGAEELDRLDTEIRGSGAAHVLVALHHPPVAMRSEWLDSVGLANGDEALSRIAAHDRVRAIVFGHVHQAFSGSHAHVQLLGTPSTCRQFLPRSRRFAVDELPPAYRRIELHADGGFEHELVWVDFAHNDNDKGSNEPFFRSA